MISHANVTQLDRCTQRVCSDQVVKKLPRYIHVPCFPIACARSVVLISRDLFKGALCLRARFNLYYALGETEVPLVRSSSKSAVVACHREGGPS